jgi:hypothetical protein
MKRHSDISRYDLDLKQYFGYHDLIWQSIDLRQMQPYPFKLTVASVRASRSICYSCCRTRPITKSSANQHGQEHISRQVAPVTITLLHTAFKPFHTPEPLQIIPHSVREVNISLFCHCRAECSVLICMCDNN